MTISHARAGAPAVLSFLISLALASLALGGGASAAEQIGQIKTLSGTVTIERGKAPEPARIGDRVFQSDTLVTGKDGSVGLTFADNSMMSLGPNSKLALDEFRFDTTTHEGVFNASLKSGTLAVKSGDIVRQTPEAMHIRTPAALLGVRGTHFVVSAKSGLL
jgi:hypothetical protein